MTEASRVATIQEQADFVEGLVTHCTMQDGSLAHRTMHRLTAQDAEFLRALAQRLRRMAPHEADIRRLVTGR